MEIIVQGKGVQSFTPNMVTLSITFNVKGDTYEEVLKKGTQNVQLFVEELLLKNNFQKEDMKTSSFVIKEDIKYNKVTNQYEKDGYSYNQMASLKFDYKKELMANMMILISKLDNAPTCQISFGIKDEKECRKSILSLAYKDAENQAQAIAEASGKKLKCCQKVDFKPFTTDYVSSAMIGSDMMCVERKCIGAAQTIVNTFTPEDIELSETLYCLWIAE